MMKAILSIVLLNLFFLLSAAEELVLIQKGKPCCEIIVGKCGTDGYKGRLHWFFYCRKVTLSCHTYPPK